ncbi:MAG TPA: competence/damage-inducible protein A [Terriglobia bacterium]|jgi:nicotinamide-nucleotide amidase|nr:competence/damage-inducible protein A [Terriglobia bacterium]
MDAEIIAVGSELLTPFRQDTNSLYLTGKLNSLGIEVRFKSIVGDDRERLGACVRLAISRSELVILSGGLGPTEDDLNREVVAKVLDRPLREVAEIRRSIEERWARLGRPMPANNLRQTLVPEGAEWLANERGTAPGLWIEQRGCILVLLPGPPWELEAMFEAACVPRLAARSSGRRLRTRIYKVVGLPESEVDRRIAPAYQQYKNPETTILSVAGTIEVHLRAHGASEAEADKLLAELGDKIELALGDHIFSTGGESLEEVVGMYLVMKQKTVAVAESCTGGLVAERLTRVPGSSNFFLGGVVAYSNDLKTRLVGVPAELIAVEGAVSKPVAQALAEGVRRRTGASIGVSISGVAGPGGGTVEKPVGLVFIALSDDRSTEVRRFQFPGDRERVRTWASVVALEMIRRRVRD